MSLATFREVLATLVLLVTVALLVVSLWAAYDRFKGSSDPADRSKHRCRHCSKEFQCRAKTPPTTLAPNGDIHRTTNLTTNHIKEHKTDEPQTTTVVETQEAFIPTGGTKPAGALPVDQAGRTILRRRTTITTDTQQQQQHQHPKGKSEETPLHEAATAAAAAAAVPHVRAGNVNSFHRRTVNVGSFPIEISEPANKTCCAVYISPEKPAERFCSYTCYRAMLKQTHPPAVT
jgi:hypothetical protein